MAKRTKPKSVETLKHGKAVRRNIPTAKCLPVMADPDKAPIRMAYERCSRFSTRPCNLVQGADLISRRTDISLICTGHWRTLSTHPRTSS